MGATVRSARSADPVALVTGAAAPDGIGAACARALAAEGCRVGLLDVADPSAVVDEIRSAGGRAIALTADLRDEGAIAGALDELTDAFGACSILVNNAADLTRGTLAETTRERLRQVLAVNVEATVSLCRRVAPGMADRGWGRIVNIASDTFDRPPGPGLLAYITSKGAVIGLTRALAVELGPSGITVNAISPGLTRTGAATADQPQELFDAVRDGQAIKRTLEPADYAGVLAFLVSDQGGVITGQTISADAGLVFR
ncbi:MAG TPA: SDR family oxidoreductase [Solirubrobacteraceae bacterium]|nr:SDR family oxidoreductase [Solirubrobacteraceae bacterium]